MHQKKQIKIVVIQISWIRIFGEWSVWFPILWIYKTQFYWICNDIGKICPIDICITTMAKIKRQDIIIVFGDFYAQIAHYGYHHRKRKNLLKVLLWKQLCNWRILLQSQTSLHTWTHHRIHNGYQLDHICLSRKWCRSLFHVRNKKNAER